MNQLKTNYLLIGIVTLVIASALWFNTYWNASHSSQLEQIIARGELRVSALNSPPSYYIDGNAPAGMDYELATLFAEYLGVKLKIEPRNNLTDLFLGLEKNEVDMLAAALIYNPERMDRFRVGPSYYSVSQQLVYRQGNKKPRDLSKLVDKLTVIEGSAHLATLTYLQQMKYPDLQWEVVNGRSSKELLRQVANGSIDYVIADSVTVSSLQRLYPQLTIAFDISEEEPVMWYINKSGDDSLYAAMLDFFSQLSEESTLPRLEEKYLGYVGGFDYVDARTFLNAIDNTLPEFQPHFEKYAPDDIDWKLLAAISYQESHWNPLATSSTGVRGLMMLTRSTAESLGVADRLDPEQSIRGGANYIALLMKKIPETIPEDERIWFALTAYNMGYAHMLDARKLTKIQGANPDSWMDVKKRLPMLTQKRYYQLTRYGYAKGYQAAKFIENIRRYKISLEGYLLEQERKVIKNGKEFINDEILSATSPVVELEQALK